MLTKPIFNLEAAIAAWRRAYEHNRVFSPEDLEELERHLRDHTARLTAQGWKETDAFEAALRSVGDYGSNETEYRKVFGEKVRFHHQTLHELTWRAAMLKSHLTIALRNLKRHPGYTFINVFGLAVGIACCILIGLYMEDELSFDRFYANADRLVVMKVVGGFMGGPDISTPFPLGTVLQTNVPEVEKMVRVSGGGELPLIREEAKLNTDQRVLFVDTDFFDVFSFAPVMGDPHQALLGPDGAVITKSTAEAYFGAEDPIGKTLTIKDNQETYTVTVRGVVENVPANSTIQFDVVAPLALHDRKNRQENGWNMYMYRTYALLKKGASLEQFNQSVARAVQAHLKPDEQRPSANKRRRVAVAGVQTAPGSLPSHAPKADEPTRREFKEPPPPTFSGIPLPSLYLSGLLRTEGFKGQMRYLYIFGSIALFVLLIAVINYVNLVTAQATQRAKEVGVRKALGAARGGLARQFLAESFLMSAVALLLSLVLAAIALPAFDLLFDKHLSLNPAGHTTALLLLPVLALLVALLAGAYPAFALSRFNPVQVLRGAGATTTQSGGGLLRKSLVVLQFTISVALIIGTVVIYRQLDYVLNTDLGFQGEQVLVVDLPDDLASHIKEPFRQSVSALPGVLDVSLASALPTRFTMFVGQDPEHISPQAKTEEESVVFGPGIVDADFIPTLGIKLLAGRNFARDSQADAARAYIINKTGAEALGWTPQEAIGKSFRIGGGEDTPLGEIIGVTEDFHTGSFRDKIGPISLQESEGSGWGSSFSLLAKLSPDHIRDGVRAVEQQFKKIAPGEPFKYTFLDDTFAAMYRADEQLSRIFTVFASLAIVIACLGLFGLAAYTSEQRKKEIGVRKVLGATMQDILLLLSKDFVKLVLIAFVLAAPLGYFLMSRWLQDFAYRIHIGPLIFIISGLLALLIAVATVSYQSVKAALSNPVDSLRYE